MTTVKYDLSARAVKELEVKVHREEKKTRITPENKKSHDWSGLKPDANAVMARMSTSFSRFKQAMLNDAKAYLKTHPAVLGKQEVGYATLVQGKDAFINNKTKIATGSLLVKECPLGVYTNKEVNTGAILVYRTTAEPLELALNKDVGSISHLGDFPLSEELNSLWAAQGGTNTGNLGPSVGREEGENKDTPKACGKNAYHLWLKGKWGNLSTNEEGKHFIKYEYINKNGVKKTKIYDARGKVIVEPAPYTEITMKDENGKIIRIKYEWVNKNGQKLIRICDDKNKLLKDPISSLTPYSQEVKEIIGTRCTVVTYEGKKIENIHTLLPFPVDANNQPHFDIGHLSGKKERIINFLSDAGYILKYEYTVVNALTEPLFKDFAPQGKIYVSTYTNGDKQYIKYSVRTYENKLITDKRTDILAPDPLTTETLNAKNKKKRLINYLLKEGHIFDVERDRAKLRTVQSLIDNIKKQVQLLEEHLDMPEPYYTRVGYYLRDNAKHVGFFNHYHEDNGLTRNSLKNNQIRFKPGELSHIVVTEGVSSKAAIGNVIIAISMQYHIKQTETRYVPICVYNHQTGEHLPIPIENLNFLYTLWELRDFLSDSQLNLDLYNIVEDRKDNADSRYSAFLDPSRLFEVAELVLTLDNLRKAIRLNRIDAITLLLQKEGISPKVLAEMEWEEIESLYRYAKTTTRKARQPSIKSLLDAKLQLIGLECKDNKIGLIVENSLSGDERAAYFTLVRNTRADLALILLDSTLEPANARQIRDLGQVIKDNSKVALSDLDAAIQNMLTAVRDFHEKHTSQSITSTLTLNLKVELEELKKQHFDKIEEFLDKLPTELLYQQMHSREAAGVDERVNTLKELAHQNGQYAILSLLDKKLMRWGEWKYSNVTSLASKAIDFPASTADSTKFVYLVTLAVKKGDFEAVRKIATHRGYLTEDAGMGNALIAAAIAGEWDLILYLIKECKVKNVNVRDANGWAVLHHVMRGYVSGSDPKAGGNKTKYIDHMTRMAIIECMGENGANLALRTNSEELPITLIRKEIKAESELVSKFSKGWSPSYNLGKATEHARRREEYKDIEDYLREHYVLVGEAQYEAQSTPRALGVSEMVLRIDAPISSAGTVTFHGQLAGRVNEPGSEPGKDNTLETKTPGLN